MGRKTTVQIYQVTNINIDRKIIKTLKQKWKEKQLYRYSSDKYEYRQKKKEKLKTEMGRKTTVQIFQGTNINIDRKIIKTKKQKWEEKQLQRYFK